MNKAKGYKTIFIDRDGTLNKEVHHLHNIKDLKILPWVVEALKKINASEYLSIIITNQAAIAKWILTEGNFKKIHKKLFDILNKEWVYVDDVFYCPHHIEWKIPKFKIDCECRKPKIGMINEAKEKYAIDLKKSFLIWDTTSDIQTGINAWLTTILVKTGYAWKDNKYNCKPDFVFENFLEAVNFILKFRDKEEKIRWKKKSLTKKDKHENGLF